MRRTRRSVVAMLLALAASIASACASSEPAERPRASEPTDPGNVASSPSPQEPVEATGAQGSDVEAEATDEGRAGFHGKLDPLPSGLAAEMRGTTWKPGCPVPLDQLRLLHFNHWGFDGEIKRGSMAVNAVVAEDVLWVFGRLFKAEFPIKRVDLAREFKPERFEAHRRITSHRSVTASFNCRPVVTPLGPGDDFSQHAYGLAIDLNPLQNPYVTASGFVRNRVAEQYVERSRTLEGMIHDGDVVVRSFAAIGWAWGGHWSGDKDYMHFSLLGR